MRYGEEPDLPALTASLVARTPQLQIMTDLCRLDTLVGSRRQRRQELLAVALCHQTRICQDKHAAISRRANETAGGLLDFEHRLGQRVARPSAVFAQVALARKRIRGARERQLGDNDAAQRLAAGVKALPKGLERKER